MSAWPTVVLGEVAAIDRKVVAPDQIEAGTRYLGLEHIERGGRIIGGETIGKFAVASPKHFFSSQHVLYGKLRPNLGKIARPAFSGVSSTDILPVLPGSRLDRSYLFHFLSQPHMVEHAASRTSGANLPRLSPRELTRIDIPLPPIEEQRRIASILDQAETIGRKRKQSLSRRVDLQRAIFEKFFCCQDWPVRPLEEVVADGTAVTYGIVQAGPDFAGGVPYIRTGDLVNGRINPEGLRKTDPAIAARFDRSRVSSGDIVMSIRATVGTTAMVPRELDGANLTQGTARISPSAIVRGPYLLGYLRSLSAQHWIERQVKGATFREITLGRLRKLPVPIPPTSLQAKYESTTSAAEASIEHHQVFSDYHHELLTSLQSRAFRGEL